MKNRSVVNELHNNESAELIYNELAINELVGNDLAENELIVYNELIDSKFSDSDLDDTEITYREPNKFFDSQADTNCKLNDSESANSN